MGRPLVAPAAAPFHWVSGSGAVLPDFVSSGDFTGLAALCNSGLARWDQEGYEHRHDGDAEQEQRAEGRNPGNPDGRMTFRMEMVARRLDRGSEQFRRDAHAAHNGSAGSSLRTRDYRVGDSSSGEATVESQSAVQLVS
jgi:hypothetical protein